MSNPDYLASVNLRKLAKKFNNELKRVTGGENVAFSIIIWPHSSAGKEASYISNAAREQCIEGLKAVLAHWESASPDIPFHEKQ